ncbi:MAG: NAD(P)/FAD-dependent oxidoreductase [Xanthomonadales bacterium]|nr:NAD(P)/FAD-dependent oxidoreductase [Xanthomonadales bacterium]
MKPIKTDVLIIGAGPVGLFQVFELGLLDIKTHVIDALPQVGGQCAELYPEKPIYDIPAYPKIGAQELIDKLLLQIAPFKPEFHLQQMVSAVEKQADQRFLVKTSHGTQFDCAVIIIAAGLGPFQPRRLRILHADQFEGTQINYKVSDKSAFAGKKLAILGGGDSALDWVLELAANAEHISLIHRRTDYRAQPASVNKMLALVAEGKVSQYCAHVTGLEPTDENLSALNLQLPDKTKETLDIDSVLVFWGLSPNLGPIANWGLEIAKRQLPVDTEKFQTSEPGIYAVGDINTYPGKKKLILSGFHEAALAAFAIKSYLEPGKRVNLQYTTTSALMQERLGVKKD